MSERRGERGEKRTREREASVLEVREYAEATIEGMQQALEAFKIEIQAAANSASLFSKAEKKFEQAKRQIKGYSQFEQIDNVKERFGNELGVLKGNVVESSTRAEGATSELSSLEKLRNLETNFAASSGKVFRDQIINLETSVQLESLEKITEAKIAEIKETEDELAHINIHFTQGLPGGVVFLLPKSATARIVDYMIMGDGEVEFMPEEHLDGIVEATNLLVSNELEKLSKQFSISLQTESQKANLRTLEEIGESYNGWQAAKFVVTIEGQEPFVMWKLIAPETEAKLEELSDKLPQEASDLGTTNIAESNSAAEINAPEQPVGTEENIVLATDFENAIASRASKTDLKTYLKTLADTNKILDFGEQKYDAAVLFRNLDVFASGGDQEPEMPAILRDKLAEFGFFDPITKNATENVVEFNLSQEVDKLKQKVSDNDILADAAKEAFLQTEFAVFDTETFSQEQFNAKSTEIQDKFVALVEAEAKTKLKGIFDAFVAKLDATQEELKALAQQKFTETEAALSTAHLSNMSSILKTFAEDLDKTKILAENEKSSQSGQTELETLLVSINSAVYGDNADAASLLVTGAMDSLRELDKNLLPEKFLEELQKIKTSLEAKLDELKKRWFEDQDKLKFVDINPEKILEALKTGKVVEGLKTLLASKEGKGKTGLQEAIQTVLQNYFEEQKSNLSLAEQKKLAAMIDSLAIEVAAEITEDFKTALEEQAHKDMGWFAKAKSKFSLLMTAQFGTTLAVGFGAGALAVALAPVFGLGVLATGGVALGGAAMGRAGIGWGFAKIRKARNESARMSAKEQAAFEQSKNNVLEKGVSVEVDQKEQKREFISTDLLATVIANKLRVKTSEDLSGGHVVDKDGKLIPEAMDILKNNVHDLIETDPRYADLSPEDKKEEEIKLISLLSLGLMEQENILLTASSHSDNPAWLKNMDRIRGLMTGNTGGNLDEMNARSAFGHVLAAGAIGGTVGLVLRSHRGLAAASAGLGGLSLGWKMGEMMADQAMVKEYYSAIDSLVEKGDGLIKDILSKRDLQLSQYTNLENDVIKIQGYLSLKQDEKTPLISDPIIRARAENFVYQFNKLKGEKFVQEIVVESEVKKDEPGSIEETLKVLATRVDKEQKELVDSLAERVQKKASAAKRRQILLAAGGAIGAAALTWFLRGGSAHAAENTSSTNEHNVAGTAAATSAVEAAKENIPDNSSDYIYRAPWEEAKNPDWHPPMAPEDASVPKTFNMTDASSPATTAESPINSADAVAGINAENVPDQAATAAVDTHHVTTTNTGALENVIRTEKGMQGHDSIWSSTKDIVKSDPARFGYTGELDDTGSIAKFAEIKTSELVGQLETAQGGDLADLVHNGDKVIVHFEGNKAILSFEESSGIKAGHLPDFTPKTEASIDNAPDSAPAGASVGPEMPVASMENFVSGKAPYSPEILKSVLEKPAELNTLAERIFESATSETQKQFLHDLYPNSFSDGTNKADVFLHYVENAPDVDVKDLDSVQDLDTWVKNFDAQANSDELPGKNWEVRLLTDDKGSTFYAMVHEAKKHIFAQDEFVVDDIKGHTWSLKEKVVESWLKSSSPLSAVATEQLETAPVPTTPAPETPVSTTEQTPVAPAVSENIQSSGRMDNVQLEGGQKLNFNYDETGKITGVEMSGRISGDTEMLKDDFRGILSSKLGRLTPDAVTAVQTTARVINLNTEFLNHLVENGQADTPEADFLADKILKDVSEVEKRYGDVFRDIKTDSNGKLSFVEVVPNTAPIPESTPIATAENPVEAPVETEIALGAPRSFAQLSQMKEGAEYHHGDLFVVKKEGALFTLDVMGKELLLIRNQADLDRFAGK